jgi:hypothetical protein
MLVTSPAFPNQQNYTQATRSVKSLGEFKMLGIEYYILPRNEVLPLHPLSTNPNLIILRDK